MSLNNVDQCYICKRILNMIGNYMSEKSKWYACKRDIGTTFLLFIFAFVSWHWFVKGTIDSWPLELLYVVILVFIECLLICRKHFWMWTIITTYIVTYACLLADASPQFKAVNLKVVSTEALYALYFSMLVLPIIVPMASFVFRYKEKVTKISPYLLLWPIGWFTGILFSDYSPTIGFAMDLAVYLAIISVATFLAAVHFYNKSRDSKKHIFWKWLSVISWLPAGLVPGIICLGWQYSFFATVLPEISIYCFFALSEKELKEMP